MKKTHDIEIWDAGQEVLRDGGRVIGTRYHHEGRWNVCEEGEAPRCLFSFPYFGPDMEPTQADLAHALAVDFDFNAEACGGDWLEAAAMYGEPMTAEELREIRANFATVEERRAALVDEYGAEWVRAFIEKHRQEVGA